MPIDWSNSTLQSGIFALLIGAICASFHLVLLPPYDDLEKLSGTLKAIHHDSGGRFERPTLELLLEAHDGLRKLEIRTTPATLSSLAPGQELEAMVYYNRLFFGPTGYIYELRHSDRLLVSYEEKLGKQGTVPALLVRVAPFILLAGVGLCARGMLRHG